MQFNFINFFLLYCIRGEYFWVVHGLRPEHTVGYRQQLSGQGNNRYLFASALSNPLKERSQRPRFIAFHAGRRD